MMSYWGGRSRRKEYWLTLLAVLAVQVVVILSGVSVPAAGLVLWSMLYVRRLHDLNRTGWWTAAMFGAQLAILVLGLVVGGPGALEAMMSDGQPADPRGVLVAACVIVAGLLVQAAFTVWLGLKRGDAGQNRFGPPPELARPKRRAAA